MGYQALLFCPDERTARTVTQVLSELDFAVIASAEPFAAVKKLMSEHFDAVVVDCDNDQNATLLFKSARNATNNQSSLAVAVVEGQAGVAKAFRMGANLVLTKPINVEQAKGTLRVARGLLRKGEAAKATTPSTSKPGPVATESFAPALPHVAATRPSPLVPPLAASAPQASQPLQPQVASASVRIASHAEPVLTESKEHSSSAVGTSDVQAPAGKTAPTIKAIAPPAIESETGALKSATAGSGKTSPNVPESSAPPSNFGFAPKPSGATAAIAAAPAREAKVAAPMAEKPAAPIAEPPKFHAEIADIKADANLSEDTPALFSLIGDKKESEKTPARSGRGKMGLLIGTAVMLVAAAVYLVSTQTGGAIALPGWLNTIKSPASTPRPAAAPVSRAASSAPTSAQPSAAGASSAPERPDSAKPSSAIPVDIPNSGMPSKAIEQDAHTRPSPTVASVKPPRTSESTATAVKAAATPTPPPIIVKHANAAGSATVNEAPPLSMAAIAPAGNGGSLPNLAGGEAAPTPVLQSVGVSQGVSQGLVLKKVQPKYPATALQMRIEGSVELLATIAKNGDISGLKILKGDPQLARAAADAVKQWKYKPYLLNGEPVEIQTQITVDFKLPR
jgi:protein TonB